MKSVYVKKFKGLDGDVYDTAEEVREADRDYKYELKQKKCKHTKVRVTLESRCTRADYEDYDYADFYVKYCRICEKDVTDLLGITDSEISRYESRQRYNEARNQYKELKKRFK